MAPVVPPPPPPAIGRLTVPETEAASFTSAAPHAIGLAPDLRKRIEAIAEQIATSTTLDAESSLKRANFENPLYSFLFNGEGAEYYAALVAAHSSQNSSSNASTAGAPDFVELLRRWREPLAVALPTEIEKRATEVFASLGNVASREAVRNGRLWIESHAGMASGIAGVMMKQISQLPTSAHRVHLLFLLHDVLQLEASKQVSVRPLILAFKPFLPWLVRHSFVAAQSQGPNHEDCTKIMKLLQLWIERGIVTAREGEEIRSIVIAREIPHQSRVIHPHPMAPRPPPPPPVPVIHGSPVATAQATAQQSQPWQQLHQSQSIVAQQLGNNHLVVLGATGPAPAGLLPGIQQLAQTPETIPVGLMASMLKQVSQRGKDMHTAFMPYKPLDPIQTPQTLPVVGASSERLLKRLQDFYDAIGDARTMPQGSIETMGEHRSRSRSPTRVQISGNGASSGECDIAVESTAPMFAAVPPPTSCA